MRLSAGSWLSLGAAAVIVALCIAFIAIGLPHLPGGRMGTHGWVALGLGTGFSIIVGGALAAVLIISRRRGFDEAAHEVYKDISPERGDRLD